MGEPNTFFRYWVHDLFKVAKNECFLLDSRKLKGIPKFLHRLGLSPKDAFDYIFRNNNDCLTSTSWY